MSAPLPFIDPRATQNPQPVVIPKLGRDRLEQAFHDLTRLAIIEKAWADGAMTEVERVMAGVDPVETLDTAAYVRMLVGMYDILCGEAHSVRVPPE